MWKLFWRKKLKADEAREERIREVMKMYRAENERRIKELKRQVFCQNCEYSMKGNNIIVCSLRDWTCPDFKRKE